MKSRAASHAALFLALIVPSIAFAAKPPTPLLAAGMPRTSPGTPTAAIRRLADAFEHESVAELAALLTADYRFHPSESESALVHYTAGWNREHELLAMTGVADFFDGLRTSVREFESGPDPEHPEAPEQYCVVVAHDFRFSGVTHATHDRVANLPADHIFYLVRGDAAELAPGQTAAKNRWYIRRWFENAKKPAEQLAQMEGHCDEAIAQAPAPLPHVLAVHSVDSPLCGTLKLLCDLPEATPASVEVFDIAGRRLAQRTLTPTAAGVTLQVEAGSGTRFAPGAYFVRLSQGRAKPVSKMVLVAK